MSTSNHNSRRPNRSHFRPSEDEHAAKVHGPPGTLPRDKARRRVALICATLLLPATGGSALASSGEFTLHEVTSAGEPITRMKSALELLDGQYEGSSTETFADPEINFKSPGQFPLPLTLPTGNSEANPSLAVSVNGQVDIPTAGKYSFALTSRGNSRLAFDGKVLRDAGGGTAQTHIKQFTFAKAGDYSLSLTYYGRSAPSRLQILASPGSYHSLHARGSNFQPVGDAADGALSLAGVQSSQASGPVQTVSNSTPIVVASGDTISAGPDAFSTGLLSTNSENWQGGGTYTWKINDATGSAGSSDGWDKISTSALSVSPVSSDNPFTISVKSMNDGASGTPADLGAGNPSGNYTWVIAQSDSQVTINGTPQSPESLLDTGLFTLNTTGFTVDGQPVSSSDFQLSLVADGNGDDIDLTFDAAPEPGTALLAGMGMSHLLLARRRKLAA